jgi:TonB-linked SusC/RagA family outer membrane protein
LSYKKDFKDHYLDVMAGYSYYYKSSYGMSANGQGALTDLIPTLNAVSTYTYMQSNIARHLMLGYFGRINYHYKHKYLLSLNARYDAASQLGKSHKWGFFPGASIGWNIHEEDFWKNNVNFLRVKLRGSYGVNGNITGIGPYTAQGEYAVGGKYLGINSIQNTILPNHDLKWEESKTFDLGVDINIFDRRIDVIFDYFNRNTDNLITQLPMPLSSGFGVITTNYGSLNNKGLELEVSARVMPRESAFQWELGFNASKVKTKIRKLPNNGVDRNRVGGYYAWNPTINDYDWMGGLQEGGKIGDLFAWKQIGIYATDQEAKSDPVVDNMAPYEDKTKFGGDTKWLDTDKNGVIDEKDIVYMGNTYPKWTGGISSTWSYKNLDLYLRMDYMTGHTIYNERKIFLSGRWAGNLNMPQEMVDKSWKGQGDIATRPIYIPDDNSNFWRGGDWYGEGITNSEFYESGNYLCIRELTLSYKVPLVGFMYNKVFKNIRLNVTGNNLHYFTKYSGSNPEFGGKDAGRYPLPRNFIFGMSATF